MQSFWQWVADNLVWHQVWPAAVLGVVVSLGRVLGDAALVWYKSRKRLHLRFSVDAHRVRYTDHKGSRTLTPEDLRNLVAELRAVDLRHAGPRADAEPAADQDNDRAE